MDQLTWKQTALRSEILGYLGNTPKLLRDQGTQAAGQTALNLGNLLCWIHSQFEPQNQRYQPIGETPTSVFALGRQFQDVGRELLDAQQGDVHAQLEERWAGFMEQYEVLKTLTARALAGKGGSR